MLQSMGSQIVGQSIATEQEHKAWARRRFLNCDRQELWVAGVWPRVGRVNEGAVAPVDPAIGWGPRTQRELCLECSVGSPPSSKEPPKILPLPEQMELVKRTLRAADQGHVLPSPHHGVTLG